MMQKDIFLYLSLFSEAWVKVQPGVGLQGVRPLTTTKIAKSCKL